MATSSKKSSVRRQKVRQLRAESGGKFWMRAARRIGPWPAAITIVFFGAVTAIALYGEESLQYTIGQTIRQPINARVTFQVENPARTQQNIEDARAKTPSYYTIDRGRIDRTCAELTQFYQEARAAESSEAFLAVAEKNGWPADKGAYAQLHALTADEDIERFNSWMTELRKSLAGEYTVQKQSESDRSPPSQSKYVLVIDRKPAADGKTPEEPASVETSYTVRISDEKTIAGRAGALARVFPYQMNAVRDVAETLLTQRLREAPLLVYDQKRTLKAMSAAEAAAEPGFDIYEAGKPFIHPRTSDDGQPVGLTAADMNLLEREREAYNTFMQSDDTKAVVLREQRLLSHAGLTAVLALLSGALFAYVKLYQGRVLEVRTRTLGFVVLILGTILAIRVMDMRPTLGHLLPIPILLATSILSLAYDRRFAIGVMAITALLVALTIRGDISLFATLVAGGTVVAFMLENVRGRTQVISTGIASGAVMLATSFAFALAAHQELAFSASRAGWAALSALLSAAVFQAILPYVERAFKIATFLTLSEWRDANKPLLQLLVQRAPGTYNHSLVLGTMAHSACEAVGANGLLAQVGALYHDIGKIHQAEYFAENQEAAISRHDRLEPRMSLLVILSHVKNGIALANEYGLPRILHQFIEEHHGTTVVRFFHHTASEKQQKISSGRHDREVSDAEFRYEGPKPRSRETAILMLCDGVEGAVRAVQEPTAGRIESTVHTVLMDRLQDGQFDDCDITLKDLHRVEESLVKSLCRFYHGRVAYPKAEAKAGQHDDAEGTPQTPAAAG